MNTFESRWPTLVGSASKRRLGSMVLEATALANGLDTVRINAESFVAGHEPLFTTLGFWGPLSSETSRAAVRMTRDRVKRKAALSAQGVRVPQSRRFGYKQTDEAIAYAQRFSRGIIVKPRALSAGRVSIKPLTDVDEIREVITSWSKTPGSGSDYLVEARIAGPEHVFYIVGDRVRSVVRRRNRTWAEEVYRDGSSLGTEIHPEVLELAVSALGAIPRTPYGEVRIAGRDSLSNPARCRVVSVRPTIELTGGSVPQEWSLQLADQMIAHTRERTESQRVTTQARVQAELTITEVPNPARLAEALRALLQDTTIEGGIEASDRELTGTLIGTPGELASLSYLARAGRLVRELPQTVVLRQSGHSEGRTHG